MIKKTGFWLAAGVLGLPAVTMAAPQLDLLCGDHAVIQCGWSVLLNGNLLPGDMAIINFDSKSATAVSDVTQGLIVRIEPVNTADKITVSVDSLSGLAIAEFVRMGDVFPCSGGSNMGLSVKNA